MTVTAAKEANEVRDISQRILHKTGPININLKAAGGGNSPLSTLLTPNASPGSPGSPASPGSPGSPGPGSPENSPNNSPSRLCPTPQTSPVNQKTNLADKTNAVGKKVSYNVLNPVFILRFIFQV